MRTNHACLLLRLLLLLLLLPLTGQQLHQHPAAAPGGFLACRSACGQDVSLYSRPRLLDLPTVQSGWKCPDGSEYLGLGTGNCRPETQWSPAAMGPCPTAGVERLLVAITNGMAQFETCIRVRVHKRLSAGLAAIGDEGVESHHILKKRILRRTNMLTSAMAIWHKRSQGFPQGGCDHFCARCSVGERCTAVKGVM